MRPLISICLALLLGASRLAGGQTLDDVNRAFEKKEYERARDFLEKLTMAGVPEAEVRLADMYIRGTGIPRNTQRGIALYESAGNKGNAEAKFFLAAELMKGVLMPMDKKRAMGLMRTAAKQKHGGAQYALCEEQSTDGSKFFDLVEAYAWCEVSSKKDHKQAGEATRRGKATLENIKIRQGEAAMQQARVRAAIFMKTY